MIIAKGYNQKLKKWVQMQIFDDGTVLENDWNHIMNGSIKKYTEQLDVNKEPLWEDDEIVSELNGVHMFIRYGEYEAYCPVDDLWMKSVGFYVEAEGYPDMPLGETAEYARKVMQEVGEIAD